MEEQKKELETTELESAESKGTEPENTAPENKKEDVLPTRSYVLRIIAGGYLVYTGYELAKNVITGAESGNVGFLLSGVAFLGIGGAILVSGIKNAVKADKIKKEQEAAEETEEEEEPDTEE